jgi:hypothetical protein
MLWRNWARRCSKVGFVSMKSKFLEKLVCNHRLLSLRTVPSSPAFIPGNNTVATRASIAKKTCSRRDLRAMTDWICFETNSVSTAIHSLSKLFPTTLDVAMSDRTRSLFWPSGLSHCRDLAFSSCRLGLFELG